MKITESITNGNQTLVSLLQAMKKLYSRHRSKSARYQKLYEEYLTQIFSREITEKELDKAKSFLHSAGLGEFSDAMRINDAKTILRQRDFILSRSYILATLPEEENNILSFLEKVAIIAKDKKELNQYLVVNSQYDLKNSISNVFYESYKIYHDGFNLGCNSSRFDDYGSLPNTNSSFIDLLQRDELIKFSSTIFLTDDPFLSHYMIGGYPDWSDHPNPAITQVLKEQTIGLTLPIDYGYGTIMILDFPNRLFKSIL